MAKPKLALIPAAQGSKFYSVLPSDGVGDFDFARASAATRINKYGLIETVASGQSRLNYPLIDGVVNGCPHHILEPARTNLVSKSKDINTWSNQNSPTSTANDTISPDGGLNADKITSTVLNSAKFISVTTINATVYSISVFVKNVNSQRSRIEIYNSPNCIIEFNWINNTPSTHSVTTFTNVGYEYYGDGWWRITANFTATGTSNGFYIYPDRVVGTNSIYAWGAQLEAGSYPTSYIVSNSGSATTRVAETANNSGDASTFNDSEGVLMAEISALADDGTIREIALSDGSTANRIEIRYSGGNVQGVVRFSANVLVFTYNINDTKDFIKASLKYKSGNYSFWVNGFETQVDTTTGTPTGLSELAFDDGNGNDDFYGNTKQIQYYDSALTDSELETLTSWTSFSEMATSQLYTIE